MSVPPDVTDYRPIVENAVAALARNTPEARREVYARVRSVVAHHLQQSGQAAAIVELETLALDLAISKVERRWRTHEAAAGAVPETAPQHGALPPHYPPQAGEGSEGASEASKGRRQGLSLSAIPRAVRMGLAIALPVVAVLIVVLAGNNLWSRNLADQPKAQDRLLADPQSPADAPDASHAAAAATPGGPTKVRPVRADFP